MFWLGVAGFGLFFLGDYNDLRLRKRALRICFPLGCILLLAATAGICWYAVCPTPLFLRLLCGILALDALGLLVYALFFALNAGEAYTRPGETRRAHTSGLYALCRHPGVLFFIALYALLWPAMGFPPLYALIYSLLNIALALFEDRVVFPAVLVGYEEYRRQTPFLLPRLRRR